MANVGSRQGALKLADPVRLRKRPVNDTSESVYVPGDAHVSPHTAFDVLDAAVASEDGGADAFCFVRNGAGQQGYVKIKYVTITEAKPAAAAPSSRLLNSAMAPPPQVQYDW